MTTRSKIVAVVLMAASIMLPLYAQETMPPETEIPEGQRIAEVEITDFVNMEEYEAYWFLTLYDLIAQGKGEGGLLAFSDQGSYMAGYVMPTTAEDFFVKLPSSTLIVPYAFPTQIATAFFAALDDAESVSRLSSYNDNEGHSVVLMAVLKLYGEVEAEDPAYSILRQEIEMSAEAHGLDVDEYYSLWATRGVKEHELVEAASSGEKSPSSLALEALAIRKALSAREDPVRPWLPLAFSLAGIAIGIVTICSLMVAAAVRKVEKDGADGYNPIRKEESGEPGGTKDGTYKESDDKTDG